LGYLAVGQAGAGESSCPSSWSRRKLLFNETRQSNSSLCQRGREQVIAAVRQLKEQVKADVHQARNANAAVPQVKKHTKTIVHKDKMQTKATVYLSKKHIKATPVAVEPKVEDIIFQNGLNLQLLLPYSQLQLQHQ